MAIDAAEALWVVVANVSGGDWSKQSVEWRQAAERARDLFFGASAKPEQTVETARQKAMTRLKIELDCLSRLHSEVETAINRYEIQARRVEFIIGKEARNESD